ncbi:peptidoglycan-binding domain-containing protein [Bradyrhizobium sp. SZCCHNS2005]|uniref:peptidoglycan-binding domain-containing protein n=1 Tax=Bradyrhizobium sp. SZCCHNS2005 TaxID=3057303 RepID=UPI0028E9C23D|nr:peptidoglycan-binding domain-containing protein [Bradyrhizobium sp. SZCCHNS2005]
MVFDTGIPKLDRLLNDAGESPLGEGANEPAVGIVHDLINRFDPKLARLRPLLPKSWKKAKAAPLPSADGYPVYAAKTAALVGAFQKLGGLPVTGKVDHATISALRTAQETKVLITPAELIFTHGLKYTHFLKAIVLTGGRECRFDFTVMNRNSDRAGLSLGVLHWAQRPKRLAELIEFLRRRSPVWLNTNFVDLIFGGKSDMDRVIAHLRLGAAGLDKKGWSKNPDLEFAQPPMAVAKYWPACFETLVGTPFAQAAMVEMAIKTFRKLYDDSYADYPGDETNLVGRDLKVYAPKLKSERAVIFALDMINQHGGHVPTYYKNFDTGHPDATEQQILESLRKQAADFWLGQTDYSPEVRAKNAAADTGRRNFFLQTKNLSSDVDFDPT